MLPFPDPLGAEDFAGSPAEMKAAHAWKKATTELKTRPSRGSEAQGGDEDEGESDVRKKGFKQKKGEGRGRGGRGAP